MRFFFGLLIKKSQNFDSFLPGKLEKSGHFFERKADDARVVYVKLVCHHLQCAEENEIPIAPKQLD